MYVSVINFTIIIITIVNIISNPGEARGNVRGSYSEKHKLAIYMEIITYRLVSAMMSSSCKLDPLFLRPFYWFWRSSNAFGDEFRRQTYFTENIGAIWVISLKTRGKIEIKEHLPVRLSFLLSTVRLFVFRTLPSFFLTSTFELMLRRGKLIINLAFSPPMDQRLVSAPYIDPPLNPS